MSMFRNTFLVGAVLLLQACSSTARFDAVQSGARLSVGDLAPVQLPHAFDLGAKATGQHEFKVEGADGKTMYGILPLKVNGGRMAVSILFFAPALAMGGFRDAYANYKFDLDRGEVLYQATDGGDWRVYRASAAEVNRAKLRFDNCTERSASQSACSPAGGKQ